MHCPATLIAELYIEKEGQVFCGVSELVLPKLHLDKQHSKLLLHLCKVEKCCRIFWARFKFHKHPEA